MRVGSEDALGRFWSALVLKLKIYWSFTIINKTVRSNEQAQIIRYFFS